MACMSSSFSLRSRHAWAAVEKAGLTSSDIENRSRILLVYDDLLILYSHHSLKRPVDHTTPSLLGSSQIPMQGVHQPAQELHRIPLFRHLELPIRPLVDLLQELVRADLGFEELWIPQPTGKGSESQYELRRPCCRLQLGCRRIQKESTDRRDVQDKVQDDREVVVLLDIVDADKSGHEWVVVESVGGLCREVGHGRERRRLISWIQDSQNIIQGRVSHLVSFRQDIKLRDQQKRIFTAVSSPRARLTFSVAKLSHTLWLSPTACRYAQLPRPRP